jgi:fatty-acyl-CoA synthase
LLSYSKGPDLPLLEVTLGQQLEETAARWPEHDAVVSCQQQRRITWNGLLRAANSVGRGLRDLGLRENDRVGLWATNCVEWVIVHFACARAGLVLVNVNTASRTHELSFILKKSKMKALFLHARDNRADYAALLQEARAGAALEHHIFFGSDTWRQMLAAPASVESSAVQEDVFNIQYTSGTTGSPKGVMLTHRNLLNNGLLIARGLKYGEQDRICVPVPMAHCFGCVIGTMAALVSGAALILPSAFFDPGATLAAIDEEKATSIYGVPTMFIAELQHADFAGSRLRTLRTGMMAGAPCPIAIMKRVIGDMHCRQMSIGYGLTETAPVITMSDIDDDIERRVQTVGKAMPCTELKIVSVISGETLEAGVQGEICTRGYMLMKGYDGEPEETARAIDSEGWFHTGDLGVMRQDGYFKVTGRAKDMIIRGGENIYPREVEEFLYTHAKIAEVHVTGLPDARLGETVLAWIKLKTGENATPEEIKEFCKGRIAHFKIPETIRFVESFPTTLSGKIQKFKIRESEIAARGLERAAEVKTA